MSIGFMTDGDRESYVRMLATYPWTVNGASTPTGLTLNWHMGTNGTVVAWVGLRDPNGRRHVVEIPYGQYQWHMPLDAHVDMLDRFAHRLAAWLTGVFDTPVTVDGPYGVHADPDHE